MQNSFAGLLCMAAFFLEFPAFNSLLLSVWFLSTYFDGSSFRVWLHRESFVSECLKTLDGRTFSVVSNMFVW